MRIANRLLAALFALALIVVGILLIVEVIAARLGHQPALVQWHTAYNWSDRTHWQQGSVRVAAAILVLLGLILLIMELKRPKVSRLPVQSQAGDAPDDVAFTRWGVAAALRAAVTDVDGIRTATVRVKRRSVAVRAQAAAQDGDAAQALSEPVKAAAQQRLSTLQLATAPRLSVRVAKGSR